MKKLLNWFIVAAMAIVAMPMLTSCGDDDKDEPASGGKSQKFTINDKEYYNLYQYGAWMSVFETDDEDDELWKFQLTPAYETEGGNMGMLEDMVFFTIPKDAVRKGADVTRDIEVTNAILGDLVLVDDYSHVSGTVKVESVDSKHITLTMNNFKFEMADFSNIFEEVALEKTVINGTITFELY